MTNKSYCRRRNKRSVLFSFVAAGSAALILSASAAQDVTYEYDELGRLKKTTYETVSKDVGYYYDDAGNRLAVAVANEGDLPATPPGNSSAILIVVPLNGFTVIAVPSGS